MTCVLRTTAIWGVMVLVGCSDPQSAEQEGAAPVESGGGPAGTGGNGELSGAGTAGGAGNAQGGASTTANSGAGNGGGSGGGSGTTGGASGGGASGGGPAGGAAGTAGADATESYILLVARACDQQCKTFSSVCEGYSYDGCFSYCRRLGAEYLMRCEQQYLAKVQCVATLQPSELLCADDVPQLRDPRRCLEEANAVTACD